MPRVKALHIIFMVTWFAGLLLYLTGYRTFLSGSATLVAMHVRDSFRSLRSRADFPVRGNSPGCGIG